MSKLYHIAIATVFTAPGILHQVLVMAENDIGSGPAVIQEFFATQLSK